MTDRPIPPWNANGPSHLHPRATEPRRLRRDGPIVSAPFLVNDRTLWRRPKYRKARQRVIRFFARKGLPRPAL